MPGLWPGLSERSSPADNSATATPPVLSADGDIYALAVKALRECKFNTAAHACASMLVACFFQLALLLLLLQAASMDSTAILPSETDMMQVQVKVLQIQLCMVQYSLEKVASASGDDVIHAEANSYLERRYVDSIEVPGIKDCACLLGNTTGPVMLGLQADCDMRAGFPWVSDTVATGIARRKTWVNASSASVVLQQLPGVTQLDEALQVLLIMALAMGVLGLFVLREAAKAVQLSYVVALMGGFIPAEFVNPNERRVGHSPGLLSGWRLAVAFCAPVLQMTVSVVAFCTAGSLLPLAEFLDDKTQFIINSVALAFILEVDDKAGDLLGSIIRSRAPYKQLACVSQGEDGGSFNTEPRLQKLSRKDRALWLVQRVSMTGAICVLVLGPQWYVLACAARIDFGSELESNVGFKLGYAAQGLLVAVLLGVLLINFPYMVSHTDQGLESVCKLNEVQARATLSRWLWIFLTLITCFVSLLPQLQKFGPLEVLHGSILYLWLFFSALFPGYLLFIASYVWSCLRPISVEAPTEHTQSA
jgi:hypothetical protein